MRAPTWSLAALCAIALLTGCDSSSSSDVLRLFTDATSYPAQASVTITLANETTEEVTVHPELCGVLPQVRGEDGWDAAPPYDRIDFACTEIIRLLGSGERIEVTFSLAELDGLSGAYRFKYGTSSGELTSNTFQVTN